MRETAMREAIYDTEGVEHVIDIPIGTKVSWKEKSYWKGLNAIEYHFGKIVSSYKYFFVVECEGAKGNFNRTISKIDLATGNAIIDWKK